MDKGLSARLLAIIDALPLKPGMRVLEIGCGPGAMAREMARRIGSGKVVAIDRSAKAIALARASSEAEIVAGILEFRQCAVEDFAPEPGEALFDLAVAVRVGALDGRHPEAGDKALAALGAVVRPGRNLHIDDRPPIAVRLPQ